MGRKQTATKATAKATEVTSFEPPRAKMWLYIQNQAVMGLPVADKLSGTFIQSMIFTIKLEMTKAVMAFEPKTSHGQMVALPMGVG